MNLSEKSKTTRSQLFRVLGDENRLRILECLFGGAINVGDMSTRLKIEQSLLSHHLASLRKSKLVISFRKGKEVFYDLSESVRSKSSDHEMDLPCCCIVLHGKDKDSPAKSKPQATRRAKR